MQRSATLAARMRLALEDTKLQQIVTEWMMKQHWEDIVLTLEVSFAKHTQKQAEIAELRRKLNETNELEHGIQSGVITEPIIDYDSFLRYTCPSSINDGMNNVGGATPTTYHQQQHQQQQQALWLDTQPWTKPAHAPDANIQQQPWYENSESYVSRQHNLSANMSWTGDENAVERYGASKYPKQRGLYSGTCVASGTAVGSGFSFLGMSMSPSSGSAPGFGSKSGCGGGISTSSQLDTYSGAYVGSPSPAELVPMIANQFTNTCASMVIHAERAKIVQRLHDLGAWTQSTTPGVTVEGLHAQGTMDGPRIEAITSKPITGAIIESTYAAPDQAQHELFFEFRVDMMILLDRYLELADWFLKTERVIVDAIVTRTVIDLLSSEPFREFRRPFEPRLTELLATSQIKAQVFYKTHPLPPKTSWSSGPFNGETIVEHPNALVESTRGCLYYGPIRVLARVIAVGPIISYVTYSTPGAGIAPPNLCFLPKEVISASRGACTFMSNLLQFVWVEIQTNLCPPQVTSDSTSANVNTNGERASRPRQVWLALSDGTAGAGTVKLGDLLDVAGLECLGPPDFACDVMFAKTKDNRKNPLFLSPEDVSQFFPTILSENVDPRYAMAQANEDDQDAVALEGYDEIDPNYEFLPRIAELALSSVWIDVASVTHTCEESLDIQRDCFDLDANEFRSLPPSMNHEYDWCSVDPDADPVSASLPFRGMHSDDVLFESRVWTETLAIVHDFGLPVLSLSGDSMIYNGLEKLRLVLLLALTSAQSGLLAAHTRGALRTSALEKQIARMVASGSGSDSIETDLPDEEAEAANIAPLCVGILNEWSDPIVTRLIDYAASLHPRLLHLSSGVAPTVTKYSELIVGKTPAETRRSTNATSASTRKKVLTPRPVDTDPSGERSTSAQSLVQLLVRKSCWGGIGAGILAHLNEFRFENDLNAAFHRSAEDQRHGLSEQGLGVVATRIATVVGRWQQSAALRASARTLAQNPRGGTGVGSTPNSLAHSLYVLDGVALWTPLTPLDPARDGPLVRAATWHQRQKVREVIRKAKQARIDDNHIETANQANQADLEVSGLDETLKAQFGTVENSIAQVLLAEWPHIPNLSSIVGHSTIQLNAATLATRVRILRELDVAVFVSSGWIDNSLPNPNGNAQSNGSSFASNPGTGSILDLDQEEIKRREARILSRLAASRRLTMRLSSEAKAFIQKYSLVVRAKMGAYAYTEADFDSFSSDHGAKLDETSVTTGRYVSFEPPRLEYLVRTLTKLTVSHARLQLRSEARIEDAVVAVMLWEESHAAIIRYERDGFDLIKAIQQSKRTSSATSTNASAKKSPYVLLPRSAIPRTQTLSFRCQEHDRWNICSNEDFIAAQGLRINDILQQSRERYRNATRDHTPGSTIAPATQFKLFYHQCLKLFQECGLS